MDAINHKVYNVYFGGRYHEDWSEDYTLSIHYENRRQVQARYQDGQWIPVGGDQQICALLQSPFCPQLMQDYFQASASVYAAIHECLSRGLKLERLNEVFEARGKPLAAPELLRILMDDCGMKLEQAFRITAACCDDMSCTGVQPQYIKAYQPRTAHVVSILRRTVEQMPALIHDTRLKEYRSHYGAVRVGWDLRLAFRCRGGRITRAEFVLWGDDFEHSWSMEQENDVYYVNLTTLEQPKALWYAFYVETESSAHWLCPDETGYLGRIYPRRERGFRLTVYAPDFQTPAWFRRSIMYQVFPDRFAFSDDDTAERGIAYHEALGQIPELHKSLDEPVRSTPRSFEQAYSPDDFYGGTFKGIESKLPYLKNLGISCLYLNPIVEARSNHRYDTSNYEKPDPILGTVEDFEHLCRSAKKQGIRILLDGVYSHTGDDSIYFDRYGHYGGEGACSGPESPYYSWYDFRHFPDDYRCWWGFETLPEVEEHDPHWLKYIVTGNDSIMKLWLKRGASGWRLDVADELPDDVLVLMRKAVKETDPDAPIIGEVWEDAVIKESYGSRRSYALGTALDSAMNYPFRTAVMSFAHGTTNAYELRDFLIGQQMNYPWPFYYALMNLLGSHDVPRLKTALAADINLRRLTREEQVAYPITQEALDRAEKLEMMCAALQFAIPGVPSIYYGDEQGMEGVGDPFNRAPFKEGNHALHDCYEQLSALRRSSDALSTGKAAFFASDSEVLIILRYITAGHDVFGESCENGVWLCVINRSEQAHTYSVDCSAAGLGIQTGIAAPISGELIRLL